MLNHSTLLKNLNGQKIENDEIYRLLHWCLTLYDIFQYLHTFSYMGISHSDTRRYALTCLFWNQKGQGSQHSFKLYSAMILPNLSHFETKTLVESFLNAIRSYAETAGIFNLKKDQLVYIVTIGIDLNRHQKILSFA